MERIRLAAVVILYYPSEEEVEKIFNLPSCLEKVILYENTPDYDDFKRYDNIPLGGRFELVANNKNDGLSRAFNFSAYKAIEEGFSHLLLLDQDSEIDEESLFKMICFAKRRSATTAIICPRIVLPHKTPSPNTKQEQHAVRVRWCISSGTMLDLNSFLKIGEFNEDYFIDRIEYEYAERARRLGLSIFQILDAKLLQVLGHRVKIFGLFEVSEHSPFRHYYIFRNRFLFARDNLSESRTRRIFFLMMGSLAHLTRVILLETQTLKKLREMKKGLDDFRNDIVGKRS